MGYIPPSLPNVGLKCVEEDFLDTNVVEQDHWTETCCIHTIFLCKVDAQRFSPSRPKK